MMDIVNMNLEAGQIVEVTTAPSTPPKKLTVPILGLEKFPTQQEIEGQDVRIRRPVRPIDRQRMRPWLMELLDLGNVFGLRWTNRDQGIFQISWRHASRLGWNLETDGDVFERWARHTGIYKEGDPPEPKRWKANFRCALHSLHDVMELTSAVERRGRNACRTYQFLQNNSAVNPKAKSKEKRQKPIEPKESRELVHVLTYERPMRQPVKIELPESGSSDELLSSETESEGSHQDKVIVQRVDPKSGEIGEEEFLLHDHDYSGQQDKTQRTIYLRQGVGSIVLHKEVLNAPQLLEDAKAAEALSNLEQLASAAVGSQELEGGTIMIDANVLSAGSNKGSPTKSSALNEDDSALNLKKLLPRLRARIKESERGGGILRKRKYIAEDMEMLGEKRILGHNQYRLKKAKSEAVVRSLSPNSRRLCGSPQKQTKGGTKSKRSRKESEGSASDSTEPLMSSCLLLLEAATRLDKAEKGEGISDKRSSKHGKKAGERSANTSVTSKKKKGVRSIKFESEEQEVIEEPVLESVDETLIQDSEETVIEEQIIYPEDCVQIVYEEATEDNSGETASNESQDVEEQVAFDILRSALENIGSEMEVSTSTDSPKEMAIMRRKKDSEKSSSSGYNALAVSDGKIVVTEASFAKGLFSGSEIIPSMSQSGSGVKRAAKIKNRPIAHKDNIYYVDIRSNGGSLCVKQSDNPQADISSTDSIGGITSAGQGSSATSVSPQIFIATRSGQQIVVPIKNQKLKTNTNTTDITNLKQTGIGGKSFISLGPKSKPIILKSPNAVTNSDAAISSPSSASQLLSSNVKISTLPIISTLKPIISIPASTTNTQKRLSTPPSITSPTAVSSSSLHTILNPHSEQGQTVTLVSGQADSDGQETNTYYIQQPATTSGEPEARPIKFQIMNSGSSSQSAQELSTSPSAGSTDDIVTEGDLAGNTISAHVVIDPVKGPYLQIPNSSTTIPLSQDLVISTSPTSGTTTQTFTICQPSENEEAMTLGHDTQDYNDTVSSTVKASDFSQVELYTVGSEHQLERVIKTEQDIDDQTTSSATIEQSTGQELFYTVKHEDGTSYLIPVQGEHVSELDTSDDGGGHVDENNIRVEVKTEGEDQTCFISPEQLEQANHIIHISQETEEDTSTGAASSKTQAEAVSLEGNEGSTPVLEKSDVEDEQYSVSVPSSSSMNIDPRTPLAIQEIPLFASSKGESEDQST